MAIKKIVVIPEQILLTATQEIKEINTQIKDLAEDLKDTLNQAHKPEGAGIAANQIGSNKRMCIVRNFLYTSRNEKGYFTEDFILINPKIVWQSPDLETDWEGCLSVPDKYGQVARNKKIKVGALTLDGSKIQMTAKDLFARVIQHELDHLDGILFTSKVIGKTITEVQLDKLLRIEEYD